LFLFCFDFPRMVGDRIRDCHGYFPNEWRAGFVACSLRRDRDRQHLRQRRRIDGHLCQ
jgi:hypothetical protein